MAPPKSGTIKTTMPVKPGKPGKGKPKKGGFELTNPSKPAPKFDIPNPRMPKPGPKMPGIIGMAKGGSASKGKK